MLARQRLGTQAAAVVTVAVLWVMEILRAELAFGARLGTFAAGDKTPSKAIIPG